MIRPQEQAPELQLKVIGGETWNLAKQNPKNFTMVVFYRGIHCPVCKKYTEELQNLKSKYNELGVDIIAVSMDTEAKARKAKMDWDIADIPIGYELTEEQAKAWNLYLSKGVKDAEPQLFSEPGLFLIRPDNEIYYIALNSQPFGRPELSSFVKSIDFIVSKDYPSRGEVSY
ncbi:peroxiredoxin-like family protein [Bizionia arctica]|uniref:Thioredoxin peroxidase n=1 Tax=Bizionia arctica TaxID=1495645 RepID=A0A917LNY1_9FLAO|nr:peroxiredoxin-like family protein [Bizionia arctica]GGG47668.1 thioredoxin peroxidase [Bizionia arctica]